jgi:hypothetical protein
MSEQQSTAQATNKSLNATAAVFKPPSSFTFNPGAREFVPPVILELILFTSFELLEVTMLLFQELGTADCRAGTANTSIGTSAGASISTSSSTSSGSNRGAVY